VPHLLRGHRSEDGQGSCTSSSPPTSAGAAGSGLIGGSSSHALCLGPDAPPEGREFLLVPRAGPRGQPYWNPARVRAVIIVCGGLCPGLNTVIRELVITLYQYGCTEVWGVDGGFSGVVEPEHWIPLAPENVQHIRQQGGTILRSGRGNPPHVEMAAALRQRGVNQVFVIGGDGSQKGAMQIYDAAEAIGFSDLSVCGIPKTIDNDIALLDFTFGFHTAVAKASEVIMSAYVEASCNMGCISLVKLMGRHSGSIALHAAMASRHVSLCLIPEVDIDMDKCLKHIVELQESKRRGVVIVIAEGLGDTLLEACGADAGGNKRMPDAGLWLKSQIEERFADLGKPWSIKYFDPSYTIRTSEPNAFDSDYCSLLAENAVHGTMAGYTGFCVGRMDGNDVMLPSPEVANRTSRIVDICAADFTHVAHMTRQPPLGTTYAALPCDHCLPMAADTTGAINLATVQPEPLAIPELGDRFLTSEVVQTLSVDRVAGALAARAPGSGFVSPLQAFGHCSASFQASDSWFLRAPPPIYAGAQHKATEHPLQLLRAGPRLTLQWSPPQVKALIVINGSLCPGLNSIVRELVMMLNLYGCSDVHGVHGGFLGIAKPDEWLDITQGMVEEADLQRGSLLSVGQDDPPHLDMAELLMRTLVRESISHVYFIGGYGTHEGAMRLGEASTKLGYGISMCAIPSTIDSDLAFVDYASGHNTAVAKASKAIDDAYSEAHGCPNSVGVVKLGEHSGFLALRATLAARYVDLCIIPEMSVSMDKCINYIIESMSNKKRGVVVVIAEGLKDTLPLAGTNVGDVGLWFTAHLEEEFDRRQLPFRVNYSDQSSTIRAAHPDPIDSIYCACLAQHAVHGAMAGYTGFTVGRVSHHYVMLPIREVVSRGRGAVNIHGNSLARLMRTTHQSVDAAGAPSQGNMAARAKSEEQAGELAGSRVAVASLPVPSRQRLLPNPLCGRRAAACQGVQQRRYLGSPLFRACRGGVWAFLGALSAQQGLGSRSVGGALREPFRQLLPAAAPLPSLPPLRSRIVLSSSALRC